MPKTKKYPKKPKKKTKVVINRAKWRTGSDSGCKTGKGVTALRNAQGYKCCLGFICQAAGVKHLTNVGLPEDLERFIPGLTRPNGTETKLTDKAVLINDCENTTPKQKEAKLKRLFKNSPYSLVFTGKYTLPK